MREQPFYRPKFLICGGNDSSFELYITLPRRFANHNFKIVYSALQTALDQSLFINSKQLYLVIYSLIKQSGDVHSNPGPIKIMSYNCRGFRSYDKIKRMCNKFNRQFNNAVIGLQETHLTIKESKLVATIWGKQSVHSYCSSRSAGTSIMFDSSKWDSVMGSTTDENGRFCSVTLIKNKFKYCFFNLYAPNGNNLDFFEMIGAQIDQLEFDFLILMGDFNNVMSLDDQINRTKSNREEQCSKLIRDMCAGYELEDSFRLCNKDGGFTWRREKTLSRLDYIYISNYLASNVCKCETTWGIDKSDHAAVVLSINLPF